MNKFKPKSIRYRGEDQKPFTDCSSFPKVDFSEFDFPVKIIESPMDIRVEKEMFSAIKRVGVHVDKEELLRALNYERDQYAQGYQKGYCDCIAAQPKWISVKDELPKKWCEDGADRTLVNYQIYSPRYGVDVGNYVKPAGRWVIMGLPVDDVTHWMPLPEPPKEDNDANA